MRCWKIACTLFQKYYRNFEKHGQCEINPTANRKVHASACTRKYCAHFALHTASILISICIRRLINVLTFFLVALASLRENTLLSAWKIVKPFTFRFIFALPCARVLPRSARSCLPAQGEISRFLFIFLHSPSRWFFIITAAHRQHSGRFVLAEKMRNSALTADLRVWMYNEHIRICSFYTPHFAYARTIINFDVYSLVSLFYSLKIPYNLVCSLPICGFMLVITLLIMQAVWVCLFSLYPLAFWSTLARNEWTRETREKISRLWV